MNYITGQQTWDKLASLDFRGENSYLNFFENWDIFYRPYEKFPSWLVYPWTRQNGKVPYVIRAYRLSFAPLIFVLTLALCMVLVLATFRWPTELWEEIF